MSKECKIEIDEELYVQKFKPYMMDIVYEWCKGATFMQLCKMTDIFEGKFLCPFLSEICSFFLHFWLVRVDEFNVTILFGTPVFFHLFKIEMNLRPKYFHFLHFSCHRLNDIIVYWTA